MPERTVHALQGVSLKVEKPQIVGLVGESGSGKSTLALACMRLLPPYAKVTGEILYKGKNLLALSEQEMEQVRGNELGMIFQSAQNALHPCYRLSDQVAESLIAKRGLKRPEARSESVALLGRLGLQAYFANYYPHQLSGGMKQRGLMAIALSTQPSILFADEPTTALDVVVQQQVTALLKRTQREADRVLFFISHDLLTVLSLCDRVVVLYGGRIMEDAPYDLLAAHPRHPYTRLLDRSLSDPESVAGAAEAEEIPAQGCPFVPRCPHAEPRCSDVPPPLAPLEDGRLAACYPLQEGKIGG